MTTRTKTQLIEAVLENLHAVGAGQTASAEDLDVVERRLAPAFELLSAKDIYTVHDEDEIDADAFLPLAAIVAAHCAKAFRITGQELTELYTLAKGAQDDLEALGRPRRVRKRAKLDSALRYRSSW